MIPKTVAMIFLAHDIALASFTWKVTCVGTS